MATWSLRATWRVGGLSKEGLLEGILQGICKGSIMFGYL